MHGSADPFRILVVDDDPNLGPMLLQYLATLGFEARLATGGRQGLELFAQFCPHLVLLDLMMPELDGRSVLAEIRRESTVPVMILSGLNEDQAGITVFRSGADDYLTKPYDPALLLARIVAHLRRSYGYDGRTLEPAGERE